MTPFTSALCRTRRRIIGAIVLTAALGGAAAVAETYRYGGSSTTVEQRGGPGPSTSRVIRDPDGQTVITQDGGNTDVTVQKRMGPPPPDAGGEPALPPVDRFDSRRLEQRFRSGASAGAGVDGCFDRSPASARGAFKQHMLERLRRQAP